jgi:hypothetical protein
MSGVAMDKLLKFVYSGSIDLFGCELSHLTELAKAAEKVCMQFFGNLNVEF